MTKNSGKFVVSLDFELMWGVRDVATVPQYGDNIRGVQEALPKMLDYFVRFGIHSTFATVGLLFFETKDELLKGLPAAKPAYNHAILSPYGSYIIDDVGKDRYADSYHFGSHLIEAIRNTVNQEIGTHTFSHFYCLEQGQNIKDFESDLLAAISIANKQGIKLKSLVFPRNQVNEAYLKICNEHGIICYRGNENSWIYASRDYQSESLLRRFMRLADSYLNLSGHHCYSDEFMKSGSMINIPGSRFLRPYMASLSIMDGLKLRRIKKSMTYAAKRGLLYHLWWHPHNFGINQEQNFVLLEKILLHYAMLNKRYGFESYTMCEVAEKLMD